MKILSPHNRSLPHVEKTETYASQESISKTSSQHKKWHYAKWLLAILILVVVVIGMRKMAGFYPWMPGYHDWVFTPEKYQKLILEVNSQRTTLAHEYNQAEGSGHQKVIQNARSVFLKQVQNGFFPFWYGTRWAFHGTTETPGQGRIACGYFVTTVLRDIGCEINRGELARAPSETMIQTLTDESYINRYSGITLADFVKKVQEQGDGLYIVGLDSHTGFLVCEDGIVHFVHSGGFSVKRELALKSRTLKKSQYRVTGKISADEEFLKAWLGVI